jgi:hypothetical protein
MSLLPIAHPLAVNTKVNALRPTCACRNAKLEAMDGTILKVINNPNGIWYYLNTGSTVKAEHVQYVIPQ